MDDSILDTIKKSLSIDPDDTAFDTDILMHVNSVFSDLNRLGVGPLDGFEITDRTTGWSTYTGADKNLNAVKTYMYLRVRLLFDPPATSFHLDSWSKQVDKYEFLLTVQVDSQGGG